MSIEGNACLAPDTCLVFGDSQAPFPLLGARPLKKGRGRVISWRLKERGCWMTRNRGPRTKRDGDGASRRPGRSPKLKVSLWARPACWDQAQLLLWVLVTGGLREAGLAWPLPPHHPKEGGAAESQRFCLCPRLEAGEQRDGGPLPCTTPGQKAGWAGGTSLDQESGSWLRTSSCSGLWFSHLGE